MVLLLTKVKESRKINNNLKGIKGRTMEVIGCTGCSSHKQCIYQFYEHRGFGHACEKDIVLDMGKKKVPLKCFIFSKVLEA